MEFNNLLKQSNYSLVLSGSNIKPLDLIMRQEQNIFERLKFKSIEGNLLNASLKDLFICKGRGNYPKIKKGDLPTLLKGSDIIDAKSDFVSNFKKIAKAKTQIDYFDKVIFNFHNAQERFANFIQVDEYIQFSELNPNISFSDKIKKGYVYVILSVLESSKLSVRTANDFTIQGEVTTENIAKYLSEINTNSSYSNSEDYTIETKNKKPQVFAVKTVKILFEKDKYGLKFENIQVRRNKTNEDIDFYNNSTMNLID